jgi:hypothetical protein
MKSRIPPTLQTVFADLTQQVATAPPAGSVYRRTRDGIEYLYAKVPVGNDRLDRFIGKAGEPDAEAEAAALQTGMRLATERRRLVSTLRRNGFAGPDRTLGTALDAVSQAGLFSAGAVLVGTAAYMVSEGLVGCHLPAPSLMTGDLDIAAASLAMTADPPEPMENILRRADPSFEPIMTLDTKGYPWRFRNAQGYLVELITPVRTRDHANPARLPKLEASAMGLQHLAWLIQDAVPTVALWGAGIAVTVPQPARYAVHKLIIAQKRDPASRLKRAKDLMQAKALVDALRDSDRFALEDAMGEAREQGERGWAMPIRRSLQELGLGETGA